MFTVVKENKMTLNTLSHLTKDIHKEPNSIEKNEIVFHKSNTDWYIPHTTKNTRK